ncbi:MAG: SPOR domain-containing protein [Gammaproteobacteria bacterium]|nr:SPOR domain-containing protein [Gammaproteobacteria bacterium]
MPGWLWLLAGLLLGGLIVGLAWISGQSDTAGGAWVGAQPDRPPQGAPAAPPRRVEVPPPPKPRFDFYNMLPEMEVVVPDEELDERPTSPARDAEPTTYLVQIGSFKRNADADRLKAQLALLGVEAQVVSARIGPQDTRYRVRSGPYQGRAALDKARQRLAENGFKGIVIKLDRR